MGTGRREISNLSGRPEGRDNLRYVSALHTGRPGLRCSLQGSWLRGSQGIRTRWKLGRSLRRVPLPPTVGPYRRTLTTDPHILTDNPYNPEPIMTRTLAAILLIGATCTASLPLAAGLMVAGLFCATLDKSTNRA